MSSARASTAVLLWTCLAVAACGEQTSPSMESADGIVTPWDAKSHAAGEEAGGLGTDAPDHGDLGTRPGDVRSAPADAMPDAAPGDQGDGGKCPGAECAGVCCQQTEACVAGWCVVCEGICNNDGDCVNDTYCLGGCCVAWGTGPMGGADAACVKFLDKGVFRPALQCEWSAPAPDDPYPDRRQVLGTPVVFSPNIGIAGVGVSWIAFVGYEGNDGGFPASSSNGYVRIIDGKNCHDLYVIDAHEVAGATPLAVAELNNGPEGLPEIVTAAEGGGLVAFTYDFVNDDWDVLWHSTEPDGTPSYFGSEHHRWAGPAIVDLDGAWPPEILFGGDVFTAQGVRMGTSLGYKDYSNTGQFPVAVDVDSDGSPELVAGDGIFAWTGDDWALEPYFKGGAADGYVAIADFGDFPVVGVPQPAPEIVVVSEGWARIMDLSGAPVFGPYPVQGGGTGGPPTIGDFDHDGIPEFALAAKGAYQVFDLECAAAPLPQNCMAAGIRWWRTSQDFSSSVTGSSVFDFEGDDQAEAVYADECFLRVYDGATGNVVYSRSRSSCTWNENPIVADTDADFRAEIVVGSNTNCDIGCPSLDPVFPGLNCAKDANCPGGPCVEGLCRCTVNEECAIPDSGLVCGPALDNTPGQGNVCRSSHQGKTAGIRVFRDFSDGWIGSRTIWNQHAYHVTNVNDDSSIPLAGDALSNWLEPGLNNFRQNIEGAANPLAGADATSEGLGYKCTGKGKATLFATVCNRGAAPLAADTPVYFVAFTEPDFEWSACVTQTETVLLPSQCEEVSCSWTDAPTDQPQQVRVRADDNGTGSGETTECKEDNNEGIIGPVVCP